MESTLREACNFFPVVTLTGPRQSGKTTLVKTVFKNKPYCNFENLDEREFAEKDPRAFLKKFSEGAILDEIQRVPSLLSYLQAYVDEKNKMGMFILTGSQNFSLIESLSQSLAGRTALLKLLPLSIPELTQHYKKVSDPETWIYQGFYPAVYSRKISPPLNYRSYIETYLERDLRLLIHLKELSSFQTFLRLCAGRVGQLLNAQSLAGEVGVSSVTIKSWLSILEASFVIYILRPYHLNLGKRLIKSPKLYFTDVGLASYLLGIEEKSHLDSHPLRGSLFENMVVMDCVKNRMNRGLDPNLYFYRDSSQNETDLVFEKGGKICAAEIKSSETFHSSFLKGLETLRKVMKNRYEKGYVIYSGKQEQIIENNEVIHFSRCEKLTAPK